MIDLKVLQKEDLKYIFKYVKEKYGIHFIELYDKNPHNKRINKCKICGEPAVKDYCSFYCSGKGVAEWKKNNKNLIK